jgi:hypothetical protein
MESKTKVVAGSGVAILLAILFAVFGFNGDSDTQSQTSQQTPSEDERFEGDLSTRLKTFTEGIQEDLIIKKVIYGKLEAGESQDVFVCPDARAWRVSLRSFSLVANADGTASASSTYLGYVGTTSESTISDDYTAPYSSLMIGYEMATGTLATTTSSYSKLALSNSEVIICNADENLFVTIQAEANVLSHATSGSGLIGQSRPHLV